MQMILLGPPGVGKGTQAEVISQKYNIPHISTGDIFRENIKRGSELGKEAKTYLDDGKLVPDDITIRIVKARLSEADCENGFLLDGFPRTVFQAEALEKILKESDSTKNRKVSDAKQDSLIDKVIQLDADKEVIAKRTSGRRICKECKATYNIESKPTKLPGICDICGGQTYQRADDDFETVKKRIEVYLAETRPLVEYYNDKGNLIHIDGEQEMETVTSDILRALERQA